MKTRFESLYRLSNIFEKLCDNFTTKIRKNLMSIRKRIIESLEESEMKYLLHANLTSRFQKFYATYCLELTTHEKLNCVKNIFKDCCSIWSNDESLNKKCEMKWEEFRNLMNINAIAINWAFIALNHFFIISMLISK